MKKQGKGRRTAVKVVYISSPMKVKTCASKFRALVQELTGRESEVARYMEMKEREESRKMVLEDRRSLGTGVDQYSSCSSDQSLPFDQAFDMDAFFGSREEVGSVGMMFPSSFLCEQVPLFDGTIGRFDGV